MLRHRAVRALPGPLSALRCAISQNVCGLPPDTAVCPIKREVYDRDLGRPAHILLFPVPESRYLVVPFSLIILWTVSALASGNEAVQA